MVNGAMDDSDPVEELQANHEQLKLMQERGEISATVLIADFYKPMKSGKKKIRTHALFVDVMEESD